MMSTKLHEELATSRNKEGQDHNALPVEEIKATHDDEREDTAWLDNEKRLVRKLDLTLLPIVWLMYMFNYLDRNNIAQAKLDDFGHDLGLVGNQFNVAVSILNVGYMLAQLPSNMILTRVRPSIYLPSCVAVWSCISAATAGVTNYRGLILVRLFLGVVEAPFFPGAFYLLSCWYTRRELALRTAVLYSGLVLATAFSGLIAAGVFAGLDQVRGLAGWQWLFIIEGAGSFATAMVAVFVLPDYTDSKTGSGMWLLSQEEREVATRRIILDRVSVPEGDRSVLNGLKTAVSDYRTWIFVLLLCSNHTAYGFNNFFPTIMQGFDLGSRTITLTLTAPPYLVGAIVSFIVAYSSDRNKERGWHIAIPMMVAVAGFTISVATLNVPARYFASFLFCSGCFAANSMVYSWAASVLNETPEKRACSTAIINLLAQLGNIWSPYFFPSSDEPRYIMAMLLMMSFSVLSIACAIGMKYILKRGNRKLIEESERTGTRPILYTL